MHLKRFHDSTGQVRRMAGRMAAVIITALLWAGPAVPPAEAATLTVTNTNDSGAGSLRQTIADAVSGDTVLIGVTGIISLTSAGILVDKDLTITGPGSGNLAISANNNSIVLAIQEFRTVSLTGLTVRDGYAVNIGGGILNGATLDLTDVIVSSNTAATGGGGIYNSSTGNLKLVNCLVTGNNATMSGGGILNWGALTITNSIISNNYAPMGGGLDHNGAVPAEIKDSLVRGNSAMDGAGIRNSDASISISGSTIRDNQASGNGGGINSSGSLGINTTTTISGNSAEHGGGIFIADTAVTTFSNIISATITGNTATKSGGGITNYKGWLLVGGTISGNSAQDGGGIYYQEGYMVATGLSLSNNTASGAGGGLYVYGVMKDPRDVAIMNCTISGNSAYGAGGIFNNYGKIEINTTTISGNTATVNGGGIFNYNIITINDCTITGNTAEIGGGLRNGMLGVFNVKNSIVADNTATDQRPDCSGVLNSNDYNLIRDVTGCTISGSVTHNIYGQSPLLGPLQNNGGSTFTHSLQAGSPANNAGGGCGSSDQRLISRPQDGVCDIGAVEMTWPEVSDLVQPPGNALAFDGTDDYVTIADADALDLTTNYTIEAWIRPEEFKWLGGIVSKWTQWGFGGYTLRMGMSGAYSGVNFDGMETAEGVLQLGMWQHIAAVNDNGTRHLYVNGTEIPLSGIPIVPEANSGPVAIGMDWDGRYFKGAIDEVRIWSKVRSQAEIQASLTRVAHNADGLVAYYRFDQGSAGGDNAGETSLKGLTSPDARNGTLNNFALSGPTSNWVDSGAAVRTLSLAFSGAGSVHGTSSRGQGYACVSPGCAPVSFISGDQIGLTATGSHSTFSSWSGHCSGSNNPCTIVLDSDKDVTATFTPDPAAVRIDGDPETYYELGAALAIPAAPATLRARSMPDFVENIVMTNPETILLKGGYVDTDFSSQTGYSTISGSLKIRSGTLRVERLNVRP